MFKILAFSSRKDDVGAEALRQAYEEGHVPLLSEVAPPPGPYRRNYVRRDDPANANVSALDFDVVTELEFASRAEFERWMEALSKPATMARVNADLARFSDLSKFRMCVVDVDQS